jgi:hypothetical protein
LSLFKPRASGVAGVRRVTGLFPVRRDGHPSGVNLPSEPSPPQCW